MRIRMTQHPVGQGGFFTGEIKYQIYNNVDSNQKNASKRNRNSKFKKDCIFRLVYDCGSRNKNILKREIDNAFEECAPIDLLFLSHFDYDHINGVEYLLEKYHVEAVALPYLKTDKEKILLTAKNIVSSNRTKSEFVAKLIWDTENLLKNTGNGITRLIRIGYRDEEEGDSEQTESIEDLNFENLKDILDEHKLGVKKWKKRRHFKVITSCGKVTKKSSSKKVKTYNITEEQIEKMIWYIDDTQKGGKFLLIPYMHSPCDVCLAEFSYELNKFIENHYNQFHGISKPLKDYGRYIIENLKCSEFRKELKKKYKIIHSDHNLTSITLYAGPCDLNTRFFMTGKAIFHSTKSGGFLLTGDASFSDNQNLTVGLCKKCKKGISDERRRDRFLEKYRECQDLVGAFMMPHHGSNYNFDFSVIEPFTELVTCYAAVGPNGYNHPGFWARLQASRHSKLKFETVETISSLAMQILSIENHDDLIECIQKFLCRSPKTPLHYASEFGSLVCVRKLLEGNANVDARDTSRMTPLHYAAMSGSSACVKALIEKFAILSVKDIYNRTPLHLAANRDDHRSIRLLLKGRVRKEAAPYQAQKGARDFLGRTPLHYAIISKNFKSIRILTRDGKVIDKKESKGMTSLHYAAKSGEPKFLQILIENGAKVNSTDNCKRTPLHLAAKSGDQHSIRILLEKKAKIDAQDKDGMTPLHYAVEYGKLDNVIELICSGANLNLKDNSSKSPLYLAAIKGDVCITRQLIRNGANYKKFDPIGSKKCISEYFHPGDRVILLREIHMSN